MVPLPIQSMINLLKILQLFPRFEADGLTYWDRDFFARSRITSDASLAGLDDEDTKTSQLDPFTPRQRFPQRFKQGRHDLQGRGFRDACAIHEAIHDVEFNQGIGLPILLVAISFSYWALLCRIRGVVHVFDPLPHHTVATLQVIQYCFHLRVDIRRFAFFSIA